MFTEKITDGPAGTHIITIALILLGAFILGYWLRSLLNDNYKNRIRSLERDLSLLKNKTAEDKNTKEEVEALLKKAREQKTEIDRLNTKLSDCYADKIKAEMSSESWQKKYDKAVSHNPEANTGLTESSTSPTVGSFLEKSESELEYEAKRTTSSDLKKIEGIGPKIEQLLNADGIHTYSELIASSVERIKGILIAAGANYAVHDPSTWGEQAQLAKDGKWQALDEMQEELKGGKRK